MVKAILKEIIITVLLLVAVVLVMSVVFYDYNPINKVVPSKVQYSTSEEVASELENQETNVELETIPKTYTLDSSDLKTAEKDNSYVPGKANPFLDTSANTNTTNNVTSNTQTNTTIKNPDSTGNFFNTTTGK